MTAEQLDKLLVYNLDDLLCRRQTFQNLSIGCLLGHGLDKILCNLEVYICLKQGKANFAHGFLDIGLGLSAQLLKGG